MVNYHGACRTSYFRVTDEEAYKELMKRVCWGDNEPADLTKKDKDGTVWHAFGCYGPVNFGCYGPVNFYVDPRKLDIPENTKRDIMAGIISVEEVEPDDPYDEIGWIKDLQKIIHPDDAFVMFSVGNDKLRSVSGNVTVVTSTNYTVDDLDSIAFGRLKRAGIDPNKVEFYY